MSPLGIVRTDLNTTGTSFKNGIPVTEPVDFGTDITEPHSFGTVITPAVSTSFNSNPVTEPHNFGNIIGGSVTSGFELEDGSGVILLEDGSILLLEVQ